MLTTGVRCLWVGIQTSGYLATSQCPWFSLDQAQELLHLWHLYRKEVWTNFGFRVLRKITYWTCLVMKVPVTDNWGLLIYLTKPQKDQQNVMLRSVKSTKLIAFWLSNLFICFMLFDTPKILIRSLPTLILIYFIFCLFSNIIQEQKVFCWLLLMCFMAISCSSRYRIIIKYHCALKECYNIKWTFSLRRRCWSNIVLFWVQT